MDKESEQAVKIQKNLKAIADVHLEQRDYEIAADSGIYLEPLWRIYSALAGVDLSLAVQSKLTEIERQVNGVHGIFTRLVSFRTRLPTDDDRNSLRKNLADAYPKAFEVALPYLSAVELVTGNFASTARRAVEEIGNLKSQAERVLTEIREAASKVSVARHAAIFASEAQRQELQSKRWLWATAMLATLTLIVASALFGTYFRLYWEEYPPPTAAQAFQLTAAAVIALSILFFAVVWCGRIYRGHLHNAAVNHHRQNALQTFEAFIEGAKDDQTKNAILLQTAQAIFAPQPTGFAPTAEFESTTTPQILEIIRSVAGKDG